MPPDASQGRKARVGGEATKSRLRTNLHRYLNILQLQSCDPCSRAHKARAPVRSLASEAPHDGKLESMGAGGKRDLADGDGHMEPGYVPGSLQRRPKTRKRKLSQLWRATQAFGRARPSLLPALVVDADLRPAAAECGSWMITFQDREACTCTASA